MDNGNKTKSVKIGEAQYAILVSIKNSSGSSITWLLNKAVEKVYGKRGKAL